MKRIAYLLAAVLALTVPAFATPAEDLTPQQLATLVASASSSAQHQRIADYYRSQADRLLVESNRHARMAAAFRANPATSNQKVVRGTVNHCQYLAETLKAKSIGLRALADQHQEMAKAAGQR